MKALPRNTVLTGDAREVLPQLLPESVDCVVTSPPYVAGVRDYGVDGQLGQEADVAGYVANLREVLGGVRRVLKDSGSLWLNIGDTYSRRTSSGAPAGSLLLAPQRVALAMLADSWIIRNVCVWAKPNPLPQSAGDRLSATYEVILLATKRRRYFFDLDALRVPHRSRPEKPRRRAAGYTYRGSNDGLGKLKVAGRVGHRNGKNPGDVWMFATALDRLGHQATFPEALVERPILATCPERICVQCDRPWTRPVRIVRVETAEGPQAVRKEGSLKRCDCFAPTRPGVVLDPFFGTGTVGAAAQRLRRDWLGIELNPAYVALAGARLGGEAALRRSA